MFWGAGRFERWRDIGLRQDFRRDCAMCFWGEALVLGPNINLPMQEDVVAPAFTATEKARTLAPKATAREQALIAAVSTRYAKDAKADRVPFDAAYASAMEKVAAQFPDDNEIAVLYAESVMDLSPWNYWQPGGREPNQQSGPIVPTLERVLARDPNHPGAIHYYIHAVKAPFSRLTLPTITRYGRIRPSPRIRRAVGRSNGSAKSLLGLSLADFIINIAGCSIWQAQAKALWVRARLDMGISPK